MTLISRETAIAKANDALTLQVKDGWESTGSNFADYKQGFFDGYAAGLKAAPGVGGWLPIDDKAKDGKEYLLYYKNDNGKHRIVRGFWVIRFTEEAYNNDHCEYNEELDNYFTPEGWYESIDNWDDYSHVAIHNEPTHYAALAQYIWVVEFATQDEWNKGQISARAILDATASVREFLPLWLFHNRKKALIFDRQMVGFQISGELDLTGMADTALTRIEDNLTPAKSH